jgi:hypothetical protein
MLPTEATLITWLSNNWPTLTIGLSGALIYATGYIKLVAFLARVDAAEKAIVKLNRKCLLVRMKVEKLILQHCSRHEEDLKELLKPDREEDEE